MNREEVKFLICEGKQSEVKQKFEDSGYRINFESIRGELVKPNINQVEKYLKVCNTILASDDEDKNTETWEEVKKHLRKYISSDSGIKDEEILDCLKLEYDQDPSSLFKILWDSLHLFDLDDEAIAVSWAAVLYLSL